MARHNWCKNVISFSSVFFLLLLCLHRNTVPVCLVFFSVPSAVKLKQIRLANSVAKLTASARWGFLTWRMITSCGINSSFAVLGLYFQLYGLVCRWICPLSPSTALWVFYVAWKDNGLSKIVAVFFPCVYFKKNFFLNSC